MMISDALDSHVYPIRTEMTGTKHFPISHIFSTYKSKSEEFLAEENLLQVCSTDEDESRIIIVNESSMEDKKSEIFHKSISVRILWLHIIKFYRSWAILTYSSVVRTC